MEGPQVSGLQHEACQLQAKLKKIDEEQDPASALMLVLKQCRRVEHARLVHAHVASSVVYRRDKLLLNMVVEMYGRCGNVAEARCVFERMTVRNVHSWTIMLVALVENGQFKAALRLFRDMLVLGVKPNAFTLTCVLTACCHAGNVVDGQKIDRMLGTTPKLRVDSAVCNALISMYGKCGWLDHARDVFDSTPCKNNISWTAMIQAYCRQGEYAGALKCFRDMELEGASSCQMSLLAVRGDKLLQQGQHIHSRIVQKGWERDSFLCTALVPMYSRCGSIQGAKA